MVVRHDHGLAFRPHRTEPLPTGTEWPEMSDPAPVNLHFEESGKWYSLPEWAEYFIGVGKQLASAPHMESRIVTAIAVPTRAFGAAFVSLGMVVADAAASQQVSESAHFERLFDLPPGTPVIYRRTKNETFKGVLQGPEESDGRLVVRVQVQSDERGGRAFLIGESHALKVQPTEGPSWQLPKRQGLQNIRSADAFLDILLGETPALHLGLQPKVVCALVGRRNVLEYEIRQTPLSIHVNGNKCAEGQLQDVLRVNRFVTPQQLPRSVLVAVGSEPPSSDLVSSVERGVVFDGASGFLKWGTTWPGRHQVVVLDRTDPYFDDAIAAVNGRFSQNRLDDGCVMPNGDAPPGCEILAFREAIE